MTQHAREVNWLEEPDRVFTRAERRAHDYGPRVVRDVLADRDRDDVLRYALAARSLLECELYNARYLSALTAKRDRITRHRLAHRITRILLATRDALARSASDARSVPAASAVDQAGSHAPEPGPPPTLSAQRTMSDALSATRALSAHSRAVFTRATLTAAPPTGTRRMGAPHAA